MTPQALFEDLNGQQDWTDIWRYQWQLQVVDNDHVWLTKYRYNHLTGDYDKMLYQFNLAQATGWSFGLAPDLLPVEIELLNQYAVNQQVLKG